ncbi:MAG: tetratricopeptide repeat protein, partial [Planctomycetota bacterium]
MTRSLVRLTVLVGLVCVLTAATPAAAEGWFKELGDAKKVTLRDLMRAPHDYLDVPVRFKVYFHRRGDSFNPYFTRFDEEMYVNFSAWPFDARLYEKRDFQRSYPFFFMLRVNPGTKKLRRYERMEALEVDGYVRDVFKGQPWIEVVHHHSISDGLTEQDVRHVVVATALHHAGRYLDAVRQYKRAMSSRHSDDVAADIHRRCADALFAAGDYSRARYHYRAALRRAPDSQVLVRGLSAAEDGVRRQKQARKGEQPVGPPLAPAPFSQATLDDPANGVDEIVRLFEDPDAVRAEVERQRKDLRRRAAQARARRAAPDAGKAGGEEEVVPVGGTVGPDGVEPEETGCGPQPGEEQSEGEAVEEEQPATESPEGCGDDAGEPSEGEGHGEESGGAAAGQPEETVEELPETVEETAEEGTGEESGCGAAEQPEETVEELPETVEETAEEGTGE